LFKLCSRHPDLRGYERLVHVWIVTQNACLKGGPASSLLQEISADQMADEYQRRRQLAAQEDDESPVRALQTPIKDGADATSQRLEDKLRIARRMTNEIDLQNE